MPEEPKRPKRELVPGRKIIDDEHLFHVAGVEYEASYLNDSSWHSVADESSSVFDTTQMRNWRKKGFSGGEVYQKMMEAKEQEHDNARKRLKEQMNGAKTFDDLMKQTDEKRKKEKEMTEGSKFAVPMLRKPMSPCQSSSSSSTTSTNGRPGMSCSTPKNGANATFRPLRQLNISQVVPSSESLISRKIQPDQNQPNVVCSDTDKSDDSLQNTFVVKEKEKEKSSTTEESELRRTFTIVEIGDDNSKEKSESSSLQKTITIRKDADDADNPNETVDKEEATFVVPSNNTIIIEKRVPKKITIEEREKRNMSFSFGMTPSPGSNSFLHRRKQMRPSISTAQKPLPNPDRLSTGSEKERTIAMLSINEVPESEVSGSSFMSSYVDAASINRASVDRDISSHSREITPVPEINEKRDTDRTVNAIETQTEPNMLERIRENESQFGRVSIGVATSFEQAPIEKKTKENTAKNVATSAQTTPFRRYAMPTISSICKSVNGKLPAIPIAKGTPLADRFSLFEEMDATEPEKTVKEVPSSLSSAHSDTVIIPLSQVSIQDDDSAKTLSEVTAETETETAGVDIDIDEADDSDVEEVVENASTSRRIDQSFRDVSLPAVPSPGSVPRITRRRRVVLDDSMDDAPSAVNSYNQGSDSDADKSPEPRKSKRNNKKVDGLMLAKREIIKPDANNAGLRRSNRNRCKPLRSWLGEEAIYVQSPSGGKRLQGVTSVVITDKRFVRYRTADPKLATERQLQERAIKQERAAQRRRELAKQHKRGINLDTTQEDIVTSDED